MLKQWLAETSDFNEEEFVRRGLYGGNESTAISPLRDARIAIFRPASTAARRSPIFPSTPRGCGSFCRRRERI
jgi:hypothetical protein